MHVTATELKNREGRYLEAAQFKPDIVEKFGNMSSVLLSERRYGQPCGLEDMLRDMGPGPQSRSVSWAIESFVSCWSAMTLMMFRQAEFVIKALQRKQHRPVVGPALALPNNPNPHDRRLLKERTTVPM